MTTVDWKISQTTIIVRDPVSERVLALLTNPSPTYSCHLHKRPKIPACTVPHFARNQCFARNMHVFCPPSLFFISDT